MGDFLKRLHKSQSNHHIAESQKVDSESLKLPSPRGRKTENMELHGSNRSIESFRQGDSRFRIARFRATEVHLNIESSGCLANLFSPLQHSKTP